ncbi:hypothetical protein ADU59_27330 [Pararhizobium polonicum]|uniref:YncI copper-binding domain-containing protein n=1 Tax=Pararhizobium polonicum TaxID=1612624 RepID=A0A1C7NY68_9HYPH|nr:DUF1775 domain-containing protein [Pararhizobium polonicum]OBZ92444.1 hypothetical protein ADU59_27330 [Pararhizobium polonicum]
MTQTRTTILALAFSLGATATAHAHASFQQDEVASESSFNAVLQIPHGCDGKATTEVQVKLPEGFVFAKPQPKAGWELEIIKGDYRKSYDNHGKSVTAGPLEIRWKNGNLSDDYYDTFVINGKISGFDKETQIAFPVTQLCGASDKVVWDQIAAEGQSAHALEHPAPTVTVTPAQAGGHHHDDMAGMAGMTETTDAPVRAGALEISGGTVKAMLPGAKVGGGGFIVKNDGSDGDMLVSVESPAAGRVELHEMTMQNDVMKMRKLEQGVAIPAGETVTLESGGLHLMFMDVKKPFTEGDSIPVTLTFDKAGKVSYVLAVGNAAGGAHKHK